MITMFEATIFEATIYYLIMSITGGLLVLGQITIAVWIYKQLRRKRPIKTAGDQ